MHQEKHISPLLCPLIHLSSKYLFSTYYVSGALLSDGDKRINMPDKVLVFKYLIF